MLLVYCNHWKVKIIEKIGEIEADRNPSSLFVKAELNQSLVRSETSSRLL